MTALVWFRNDLRCHDNPALYHACQRHQNIIGIYIATPGQWKKHDMAPIQATFIHQNLASLQADLARLGIPLHVLSCDDYSDCVPILSHLVQQTGSAELHFNREYPLNEYRRDEAVIAELEPLCACIPHEDQCVIPPGLVVTQQGTPFKVFTPFSRAWQHHPLAQQQQSLPPPSPVRPPLRSLNPIPPQPFYLGDHPMIRWPPGEHAALNQLQQFLETRVNAYAEYRDLPGCDGTSVLSPYLALGVLSPRACYENAYRRLETAKQPDGLRAWINELIWREFYIHLMHHYPKLSQGRCFQAHTEAVPWRDDPAGFQAWCDGKTGIPLVDAAMRQLLHTGWMHNRLRMVTAMFLTKNLLIDWRKGERFFMQHLIDGFFPANNGGWQWAASTGTDAAPYFRVFNPTTQGQRFDPTGTFIRQYLPELQELDAKRIHTPHHPAPDLLIEYPLPIVDLGYSRQRAIDVFKTLDGHATP